MITVSLTHCLLLCLVVAAAAAASSNITTDQQALLALKDHIIYDPTNLLAHNWTSNTSVCTWIGITCDVNSHRVTALDISQFNLQGTIPPQLGNLSSLTTLNLSHNKLSGNVSPSIYTMHTLKFLDFTNNQLSGSVSSFVFNMSSIVEIRLTNNRFSGNLSMSLKILLIANCSIIGNIPRAIGNLSNLLALTLEGNKLTGPIPTTFGQLQKLQGLFLTFNKLVGSFPDELCHLDRLAELVLLGNKLSGSIPSCLCNLTSLRSLYLGSNRFTSVIPSTFWSLKDILFFDFSSNFLVGPLSLDIGNLKVLVRINLSKNNLSGDIPTTIGGLKDLQFMDLAYNRLEGPIPESFGDLISLEVLNLSNNKISGSIPTSMEKLIYLRELNLSFHKLEGEIPRGGIFTNFTAESFMGNELLCGLPNLQVQPCKFSKPRTEHKSRKKILLIVIVLPLSIALTIAITLALKSKLIECGKRCTVLSNDNVLSSQATQRRFSYLELLQPTDNFAENNIIGRGGFGSVYGARLEDGMKIAVKVFHQQCASALKSFEAECEVLKNIRHRNLIKVISSCSSDDFKALVLEYMSNGSLEDWLHSSNYMLNIFHRLNIMIDVASALKYLHFDHSTRIIHCDLKPNNVLLDENMVAHLSDFGIAKLLSGEDESTMRTKTLATIGYMAPDLSDARLYHVLVFSLQSSLEVVKRMRNSRESLGLFYQSIAPEILQLVSDLDLQPKTSMVSTKIDLEKFTGKNDFNMWKVKIEALLITHGLRDALEPVTKKEGKEESFSKTPEMAAEIDKKVRSTIILSLGDSVIREVAKEKTVTDLWAKLEKIYMTKSLANRLYIKRRMFTLKMAEGSSLDDHIDEFNQVCDTLETIDEGLDDEGKALLLVSSLPQSYSNLVDALMYGRSTLSLNEVKAVLNTRGLKEKSRNMMHAEGLSIKGKFNKNNGKKKKQKQDKSKSQNKKYFHCNKEGHFKRDCQELKSTSKERNGDAATMEEEGHESAGVCVATEDLQRDGGKVMMGNNAICKVIGMGNVSLRLHDGTTWELREVRYVPDLKRNLISLGITDVIVSTGGVSTRLWHLRLGHMSVKGLKELEKQGVLGKDKIDELDFCEDCVFGKSTRHSFKHSTSKSIGIRDYIHSDLWGPAQTSSLGGNIYFLSIIDDHSRRVWVYVLKHKDQVFNKFKEWKTLVENQTGKKVKKLRIDNGLEFCNQQFSSYCANEGIARHKTVRLTPQHNGLAERINRTLMDKVRCMLVQAKLPKGLWAKTLLTTNYLVSLSPSAALDFKTPFEIWHGKPASYVNLKVFGCPTYAHVNQGKLAPRALKGQFLGYPDGVKGYKLWCTDLEPPRCIISRDVAFNEKAVLEVRKDVGLKTQKPQVQDNIQLEVEHPDSKKSERGESLDQDSEDHDECSDPQPQSQRQTQVQGVKEGLTASEPSRYKARLVAKGYTQREGVDFKEVFSPVVRHAPIRVLLAMTAVHDLELDQLDVKTAFLHGRLHEEILMTQPEGYVDFEKPNHVCLLKRSLYGLKQSPRQWYLRFDEFMLSHGYLRCSFDCCVYYKLISTNLYIYLLLYVDDMLVAYKSREEIEALKNLLSSEFEMKDLGSANKILGMEIKRDRSKGIMFLSQEKYLRRVLETFGMTSCKPVMTPIATHFKLSSLQCPKTEKEKLEMAKIPYANAVGCMMYAMVLTRLDISYALSVVSKYMVSPGKEHWRVVKWVLRYLSGTLNQGLVYRKSGIKSEGISGFVDSDFAGDLDRRRSLIGYLYMLNGCLINWKASLQHVVALSTTEAGYTAAAEAVKEALWMKGLIAELRMSQKTVDVLCDSSSAIYLSKNTAHHEKTKHINIKLHFIRNVVSMGVVRMVKIHTDRNHADMLTKVVTTAKFKVCLDIAGLGCCCYGTADVEATDWRAERPEEKEGSWLYKASCDLSWHGDASDRYGSDPLQLHIKIHKP
ncbi:hypothetical protein KPL70_025549 [Citrus sinensis]|nr:hypothetical protein KPL70_025549 [Citrus sinensis]